MTLGGTAGPSYDLSYLVTAVDSQVRIQILWLEPESRTVVADHYAGRGGVSLRGARRARGALHFSYFDAVGAEWRHVSGSAASGVNTAWPLIPPRLGERSAPSVTFLRWSAQGR